MVSLILFCTIEAPADRHPPSILSRRHLGPEAALFAAAACSFATRLPLSAAAGGVAHASSYHAPTNRPCAHPFLYYVPRNSLGNVCRLNATGVAETTPYREIWT